jgi:ribosomal protein S18 acetylase RimI-like enzyme
MDIVVRVAEHGDIPRLVQLWNELMDHHAEIDQYFQKSDVGPANFERFVSNMLLLDDSRVLVAMDDGSVVGYCIGQLMTRPPVFKREVHGFITDMTVTSSCRRQGVGTRLLAAMMEWFDTKHIDRVELNVVPGNAAGVSFWRKQGFGDYMHVLYREREHKEP